MMRAVIIVVMFFCAAYILGFTDNIPNFTVRDDMTVPDIMKASAKYNPHSISPKQLEELSKVPYRLSPAEMQKRGQEVQNRIYNKIVSVTEGVSVGKMINSIQKMPVMLMKLMRLGEKKQSIEDNNSVSGTILVE